MGPRREIGIRTLFNLLGPLTNPAGAKIQLTGVHTPELTEKMAHVLKKLGTREAFVVCGPTRMSSLKDGAIRSFETAPEVFGLKRAKPEAIKGGNAEENAQIIRDILNGEKGPKRDMVLLNASAAFAAAVSIRVLKEASREQKMP